MVGTARAREHIRNRMSRRRSSNRSVNPLLLYAISTLLFFIPWLKVPIPALRRRNHARGVHEFIKSHIGEKRFGDGSLASIPARSFHGFRVTAPHHALSLFYFLPSRIESHERFGGRFVLECLEQGGTQP
jgi:hypothetical protein